MKTHKLFVALMVVAVLATATPSSATTYTQTQRNKQLAHEIAEMVRAEGHGEDHPIILAAQEWWQEEDAKEFEVIEYTTMEQRAKYPVACAVWQMLRDAGLSEVSASAIIGNGMAESGGHTLDLNLYQLVDGFYGIWAMSVVYFPDVVGKGVPGQVEALLDSLDSNMAVAGGSEKEFRSITDVRQAAKYFSDKWERPAQWSSKRADDAEIAYRFFVGE